MLVMGSFPSDSIQHARCKRKLVTYSTGVMFRQSRNTRKHSRSLMKADAAISFTDTAIPAVLVDERQYLIFWLDRLLYLGLFSMVSVKARRPHHISDRTDLKRIS